MKKQLHTLLLFAFAIAGTQAKAQTLIHYWSFNNYEQSDTLPNIAHIKATYSTIDTNEAIVSYQTIPGTSVVYSSFIDNNSGDTLNLHNGEGAGDAIRPRNPADSMELLFSFPTKHYQHIALKFETQRSSATHGALKQLYDFSINEGATWSNANMLVNGVAIDTFGTDPLWQLVTVTLNDTTVNDTDVTFRVRFSGNVTGTQGNNRFDNLSVQGDTLIVIVPVDTTTAVGQINVTTGCTLYPNPATNTLNIVTATDGAKTITIYNLAGQLVYTSVQPGKNMMINISSLEAGMYFTNVTTEKGDRYRTKFIKQ